MRIWICGALALFAASSGMAATGGRQFEVADQQTTGDRYPDRITHWPGGVTSLADVTYSVIDGYRPMVVDIYMPPKQTRPKPLVLYIHGGRWMAGNTRRSGALANFPAVLARLASEGFVVASLEYRLSSEVRFPAQVQDVRAALRFLKSNAAKYGIDPARTGIWGGSAGGHLTAMTAATCGVSAFDPAGTRAEPGSECVQAAVTWYGVFDFAALAASGVGTGAADARLLIDCKGPCTPAEYATISPVTYLDAKAPPFLLIHGVNDQTVPVSQSHIAEGRLQALGRPVEAVYIDNVDHSFVGKTPEQTRAASNRALNLTFDFLHRQLDRVTK